MQSWYLLPNVFASHRLHTELRRDLNSEWLCSESQIGFYKNLCRLVRVRVRFRVRFRVKVRIRVRVRVRVRDRVRLIKLTLIEDAHLFRLGQFDL